MSKSKTIGIVIVLLSAIAATDAASQSATPGAGWVANQLEQSDSAAANAERTIASVVLANPVPFPPDPCADQGSAVCRSVNAMKSIDAHGEALLSAVETLDDGSDRRALRRRLKRAADTAGAARLRLEVLGADWERGFPPDPCTPAVQAQLDEIALSAESGAVVSGELDTCSTDDAVHRRLRHVTETLRAASSRLVPFAANPLDPDDQTLQELDAIIQEASALVAEAQALGFDG